MIQNVDVAAETPPRKKKIRHIVAAVLLGIIVIYIVSGALFWKIGMPAFMFGYEKNDNGGITITNYYGPYLHVHIPDKIDGLDVTEIGFEAFGPKLSPHSAKDKFKSLVCRNIREVRLPDTVEKIDLLAFGGCNNLTDVNIPSSLRELGGNIFMDTKIKEIELPEGMTKIDFHAFLGSSSLEKVTLPDSIEAIDCAAFADCNNLKEINLPDGLKIVSAYAFDRTALSKVTLPDSVEEIDYLAFADCKNLKEINVPEGLKKIYSNAFLRSGLSAEQKQAFFDKAEEVK
ncbi:leucine-rich repeat domain-containing protein [Ruminococcus albus]|uniref:Leucine rich repeat-containing protein n=1 Tax=Ruminococcus albus TaxID=1264 RepID=A0A1I1EG10_RUMAL|nr:leucine-rich repeat domain-containing protein [Ruminococcus albus]SFB86094.1 Leucine rich repeat-containing protein [Ruminococcus albus]